MDTVEERESGVNGESSLDIFTLPCVKQIAGEKSLNKTGSPAWHSVMIQMDGMKEGDEARFLCPWGFSREDYQKVLPYLPPGDRPNPEIEPRSPTLQADSLPSEPPGKLEKKGREAQQAGDICKLIADLHCYTEKPTQHCKAIFLQLKNKFRRKRIFASMADQIWVCFYFSCTIFIPISERCWPHRIHCE